MIYRSLDGKDFEPVGIQLPGTNRYTDFLGSGPTKSVAPKKRTMSAGARKQIGAAQRARWAKVRAERKAA